MPITSDMRWLPGSQCGKETYPKIRNPILHNLGFHIVYIIMLWACLQLVPEWSISKLLPQWLWEQLESGSNPAEKNLSLMQRVHIKNLPAPLCSGLCISWCLDTYRSPRLNKEACQRGASVNREIIQTVRHRLIKTSSPFTALVLH